MSDISQPRLLRVFLCHSSGDKEIVRLLNKHLIADGIDTWFDEDKLLPGQDWRLEIFKAVRKVDAVIVCLSQASSNKAGFIQREIKYALDSAEEQPEGAIFIIPLRLEECPVPERLRQWQWVDYFSGGGYERLLSALRSRAGEVKALVNPALTADAYPMEFYEEIFNKAFREAFAVEQQDFAGVFPTINLITFLGSPGAGKTTLTKALLRDPGGGVNSDNPRTEVITFYSHWNGCVIADTAGPFDKKIINLRMEKYIKRNTDVIFYLITPTDLSDFSYKVTLSRLKRLDLPLLVIVNKIDSVPGIEFGRLITNVSQDLDFTPVFISAKNDLNLELLDRYMKKILDGSRLN